MDPREAIETAKAYLNTIYQDENVSNLGLEEVEYLPEPGVWKITISFNRSTTARRTPAQEMLEKLGHGHQFRRSEKILTVNDGDRKIISMKNPDRQDAA